MLDFLKNTLSNKTALLKGNNLKARCARSSVVLGTGAFFAKGSGFASKVILTRLLVPEVMGLMVLVLSITALLSVLTEIGIKQSVIQNKNGADSEYLNMAWWMQCKQPYGIINADIERIKLC